MFNVGNGPPYSKGFLERYRTGQIARNRRITSWVREQLAMLDQWPGQTRDLPFTVHGTVSDPRFLDLTIDPSDRAPSTPWGPPSIATYSPVSLGHQSSLRSWLSQWSLDDSNGDGRVHAARIGVPVLVLYGSADELCFPSQARAFYDAVPHQKKSIQRIDGATHYFEGRPDLVQSAAGDIADWAREV
jgi:pimeloyl-ACP methyl ester carboxylesterase